MCASGMHRSQISTSTIRLSLCSSILDYLYINFALTLLFCVSDMATFPHYVMHSTRARLQNRWTKWIPRETLWMRLRMVVSETLMPKVVAPEHLRMIAAMYVSSAHLLSIPYYATILYGWWLRRGPQKITTLSKLGVGATVTTHLFTCKVSSLL